MGVGGEGGGGKMILQLTTPPPHTLGQTNNMETVWPLAHSKYVYFIFLFIYFIINLFRRNEKKGKKNLFSFCFI